MNNIRLEYQKLIDQTTKFYFTLCIALITLSFTFGLPTNITNTIAGLLIITSSILSVVSTVWLVRIRTIIRLLKAEINYLMETDKEAKKYFTFIDNEMEKQKRKKEYQIIYPHHNDNILPAIFLAVSFIGLISGILFNFIVPN